jgi:hypothetical protein
VVATEAGVEGDGDAGRGRRLHAALRHVQNGLGVDVMILTNSFAKKWRN